MFRIFFYVPKIINTRSNVTSVYKTIFKDYNYHISIVYILITWKLPVKYWFKYINIFNKGQLLSNLY